MKYVCLLFLLIIPQFALAQYQEASLAWFSDAAISNSYQTAMPDNPLPSVAGTVGNGVLLNHTVAIENPLFSQSQGLIGFWIKPNWDGNDGQTHRFLRIGDPTTNGLLIEKSAQNTLRFVVAGPDKVTAARADVSNWRTGEWHHIVVGWTYLYGYNNGISLWIDKVAVNSEVFGSDNFMNPTTMTDQKAYLGDTNSNAVMDELMFRSSFYSYNPYTYGQVAMVYRDNFQTAPYTSIKIDNEPNRVKSETRVVLGCNKQFGLLCLKEGKYEPVTDFAVRYNNWGDFDAKPFIEWSTSDSSIATVYSNGIVFGTGTGHCTLTARFRGMTATYDVEVISPNQPDADLMYVERTPKYLRTAAKKWPDEGETVQSIAHVGNFGQTDLPAGTVVKFELISDANGNFVADADEAAYYTTTATIDSVLAPGESTTVTFPWTWTMSPTFVRVTLDPNNSVAEVCEANNQRCELNVARAFHWGYDVNRFKNDHQNKTINLVGSFSDYDWCNAETDRMSRVMRETVLPTTSPVGIQDSLRVDHYIPREFCDWDDEPWVREGDYYDGGFSLMESTPMDIDAAVEHEIGHTTLGLPDLYGHPVITSNMFLKDGNGQPYADTQIYPKIDWNGFAMWSSATYGNPDACGFGYSPLMVGVHLWLHPANAGLTQHYRQQRKGLPDVEWDKLVPKDNRLQITDVNDQPLAGAAVYAYQVAQMTISDKAKYFADRPKFIGNTDSNGYYTFPHTTDATWDDWDTDKVDGAITVAHPFARVDMGVSAPSYRSGDIILLKIVSGTKTEFKTFPFTELTAAYCSGNTDLATYPIRTSLAAGGFTQTVSPVIPPAIRTTNQKPVVVIPSVVTVSKGQSFTIDASQSYDPEGQPLTYRWVKESGPCYPDSCDTAVFNSYGTWSYEDSIYDVYVIDGLRMSEVKTVTIKVQATGCFTGKVTDNYGNPVSGAVVGIKKTPFATADASTYVTTDTTGTYTAPFMEPGYYYLAVWKDGWTPSEDTQQYLSESPLTVDLKLTKFAGDNLLTTATPVAASNTTAGSSVTRAIDGSLTTGWSTDGWPASPVYYYIDLEKPTDITGITLYRFLEHNEYGGSADDYSIDLMTSGSPLDPASWTNNSSVETIYSATNTLHGYSVATDVAVDPIKITRAGVRGIRISMDHMIWPPNYEIREIIVHSTKAGVDITDLKSAPAGTVCRLINKQLTALQGGGLFIKMGYLQEIDRSSAIRLDTNTVSTSSWAVGDVVNIRGTVKVATNQERYLQVTSLDQVVRHDIAKPLVMSNRDAKQAMAKCRYVKVYGNVDSTSSSSFVINDKASKAPITVNCSSLAKPAKGRFVWVRGILAYGTSNILYMRTKDDWGYLDQ